MVLSAVQQKLCKGWGKCIVALTSKTGALLWEMARARESTSGRRASAPDIAVHNCKCTYGMGRGSSRDQPWVKSTAQSTEMLTTARTATNSQFHLHLHGARMFVNFTRPQGWYYTKVCTARLQLSKTILRKNMFNMENHCSAAVRLHGQTTAKEQCSRQLTLSNASTLACYCYFAGYHQASKLRHLKSGLHR